MRAALRARHVINLANGSTLAGLGVAVLGGARACSGVSGSAGEQPPPGGPFPGGLQPHMTDPPPALPGEQELPRRGQRGDPVHDRLRLARMPLGGRPGVHDVGDLPVVRVDPGQVVRARHVGPYRPRRPGEIVQAEHPAARAADVDHRQRAEGIRVAADELAGPIAGHDPSAGGADAPAFPVVGHPAGRGKGPGVPAQRDALPPGQLPDDVAGPADALAEQVGGQGRAPVRLAGAQRVAGQRRLPVLARGLPDRLAVGDQALGKPPPRVHDPPDDPGSPGSQLLPPSPVRTTDGNVIARPRPTGAVLQVARRLPDVTAAPG